VTRRAARPAQRLVTARLLPRGRPLVSTRPLTQGGPLRRLVVAGIAARIGYAALTEHPPGGEKAWTKTNHRGEQLTLLEGPAVAAGAVAAAIATPGLGWRRRLALAAAGTGAAAFGRYDDLADDDDQHGFRGHLGALAKGRVTSGAVKIAGIGMVGVAAALLLGRRNSGSTALPGRATDVLIDAGLVAGGANLLNLFDLRPGRAIKAVGLGGLALAAGGGEAAAAAAAPAGAALALLPEDLGEEAMLGDAGANALGAMLGVAATALPRPVRLATLAGIVALTAASEKVSFTKVIERTPALHRLDMLGRRQR